jgi:ribosomal protein L2
LAEDAFVVKIIKDPFRSVSLSLIFYQTGFLSFVVLPEGFLVGDKVKSSFLKNIFKYKLTNQDSTKTVSNIFDKTPLFGLSLPISMIETGYTVFNIEL